MIHVIASRRFDREQGQVHRPAILHPVALFGVLALRYGMQTRPRLQLHAPGSAKARGGNGDDNWHGRWRASVWEGQHFSEHGRQIPKSGFHSLYPISERCAVLESSAV